MPLTSEHLTFARQRTESNNTTFVHGTGIVSDYKRCSMTCIVIIIVILALGFIVLFAFIIRKCNERTLALRTRIQSFIVSEPGSVTIERAQELDAEMVNLEEDGDPILINVTNTQEKQNEESSTPMTTEFINTSSGEGKSEEDLTEVLEESEIEKKGAID